LVLLKKQIAKIDICLKQRKITCLYRPLSKSKLLYALGI
jgi:hypothetical protein